MRRVMLLGSLGLLGCDQVFGLDSRDPADAAPDAPICWDPSFTGNEDTDTHVDGCDNCPLITNQPQRDADQDGIGDACDPNPDDPIEEIAGFEPMPNYKAAAWTALGNGAWDTGDGGDDIKQSNQGNTNDITALLVYKAGPIDQPMIQIKILGSLPDGQPADLSAVGLYVILDGMVVDATPNGMICGIEFPATTAATVRTWSRVKNQDITGAPSTAALTGVPPTVVTLSTNQIGKAPTDQIVPTCSAQRGTETVITPMGTTVAPAGAGVGMWASNSAATFGALFVTQRRTKPL